MKKYYSKILGSVNSSYEPLRPAACPRDPKIGTKTAKYCTWLDHFGSRGQAAGPSNSTTGRKSLNGQQILIILFFIVLNATPCCWATVHKDKLWSLLTVAGNYGNFVYNVEPQLRLIYSDNPFQQFLANMGGGYQVDTDWQLWLGQTFSTDSQDAVPGSVDEYRIWEQVIWTHSFFNMKFISRTRFEERKSFHFTDWAFRLRERLMINKPLTQNMSLVISDEVFFNVNNAQWIITKPFDQNRAYVGFEQQLSKSAYLGAGYMSQYLSFKNPQLDHVFVLNLRFNFTDS